MRFRPSIKTIRRLLLLLMLTAVVSFPVSNHWIRRDSRHTVYSDTGRIPPRNVGLVLGCAKNIYFYYRIDAATALFKARKINYILVSGDNHKATYDETSAMKEALIKRGVPANRIVCDYAGFSTIDSIIRAKEVFGQSRITIISQEFHVRRALFIAKRRQIDAFGYCALDVETSIGARTQLREAFARVKTVLDLYLLHRKPRFLGEPVLISSKANR